MDAIPTDAYQWTISFLGRGKLKYTSLLFLGVVGEDVKKHEKVLGGGDLDWDGIPEVHRVISSKWCSDILHLKAGLALY